MRPTSADYGHSPVSELDYRTCDLREMVADIRSHLGWMRMMRYLGDKSADDSLREEAERAWKQARIARETMRLDRWQEEWELAWAGPPAPQERATT